MGHVDDAPPPLKLVMQRMKAVYYEDPLSNGDIIIHAYPTRDGVDYKVTKKMLEAAKEFLKTGVPTLRGELDPIRLGQKVRKKKPLKRDYGKG